MRKKVRERERRAENYLKDPAWSKIQAMSYEELVRWADQQLRDAPVEELTHLANSCLGNRRRTDFGT